MSVQGRRPQWVPPTVVGTSLPARCPESPREDGGETGRGGRPYRDLFKSSDLRKSDRPPLQRDSVDLRRGHRCSTKKLRDTTLTHHTWV